MSLHEHVEKMCCTWLVFLIGELQKMNEKSKIFYTIWDHCCTYIFFLLFPFLPIVFYFLYIQYVVGCVCYLCVKVVSLPVNIILFCSSN